MGYETKYIGQLLHPNVAKDAEELARKALSDRRPWRTGTVFRETDKPEGKFYSVTTTDATGNKFTRHGNQKPFDPAEEELCIFVSVNSMTGDVYAHVNEFPTVEVYCGTLPLKLSFFPRTWRDADMLVMSGDCYGRCLWYVRDLNPWLFAQAMQVPDDAIPFSSGYLEDGVMRRPPSEVAHTLKELSNGAEAMYIERINVLLAWLIDKYDSLEGHVYYSWVRAALGRVKPIVRRTSDVNE